MRSPIRLFVAAFLVLALALPGCGSAREVILVSAAASLTDVMEEVGRRFEEIEGVEVRFNFGGSTSLAQQITKGAPVDVFVSAGPTPMDRLATLGLLAGGTRVDLLTNRLVLATRSDGLTVQPDENTGRLDKLLDPDGDYRIAIADPDLAPAGAYAEEALRNLGYWNGLEGRLIYGPDVRAALAYVQTGNLDFGIVYATDSSSAGLVSVAGIPAESHSPILYPAALIKDSKRRESAERFLEFLKSSEAASLFESRGFAPVE